MDDLFHQKAEFGHAAFLDGTSLSRPCFSRNHSNYCAVGAYWFLKGHFFDGDWLNFSFFCFSSCYVLYAIFIKFVDKTTAYLDEIIQVRKFKGSVLIPSVLQCNQDIIESAPRDSTGINEPLITIPLESNHGD